MRFWLAFIVLYLGAAALSVTIVREANAAAYVSQTLNARLKLKENVSGKLKGLLGKASLGLYKGAEVAGLELQELLKRQSQHQDNILRLSLAFAGLLLFTLLLASGQKGPWPRANALSLHLLLFSLCCLAIGLLTPILALVVARDVPLLGKVVFKEDTKSILDTVRTLFSVKQTFVATLLLLFSVITPLLKTLLTLLVLLGVDPGRILSRVVKAVGKWSMADVFVVALLLTVFSLSADGLTDARVGTGLYYFAAYVVLSLLSAQLMRARKAARMRLGDADDAQ